MWSEIDPLFTCWWDLWIMYQLFRFWLYVCACLHRLLPDSHSVIRCVLYFYLLCPYQNLSFTSIRTFIISCIIIVTLLLNFIYPECITPFLMWFSGYRVRQNRKIIMNAPSILIRVECPLVWFKCLKFIRQVQIFRWIILNRQTEVSRNRGKTL